MSPEGKIKLYGLEGIGVPPSLLSLVRRILGGVPGLFAITGQPGTGKTTTLFGMALEAWNLGIPISVVTDMEDWESQHQFPKGWKHYYAEGPEDSWFKAIDAVLEHPQSAIVLDLNAVNLLPTMKALKEGWWVIATIDSPFVGIDVTYVFRGLGLTEKQILDHFSGVLSQLLFSSLCSDCAQKVSVDVENARLVYPDTDSKMELWQEVGCVECENRGTRGRCAAHEILRIDDEVRPILKDYLETNTLRPLPNSHYISMQGQVRRLVEEGLVGIETYKRQVFQNPLLRVHHLLQIAQLESDLEKRNR